MRRILSNTSMIVLGIILVALAVPVTASAQTIRLIEVLNTPWKYHTNVVSPGFTPADAWIAPDFDDSSWPSGTGAFGFESTPDEYTNAVTSTCKCPFNTFITPPNQSGGPSCYYRKHFTFANDPRGVTLNFTNWGCDGFIVYLNGVELYSFDMPDTPRPMTWDINTLPNGANPLGEGAPIV